ncbi:hypothetical protein ACKKBG_A07975 [Auxenochlorella protothecoides x Auxenochlorella symbiontica]
MSSSPFEAAASPGGRVVIPAPAVTPPPFPSEVREPLLTPRISSYRSQSMQPPSSWEAGTHMVKSILGVALLALPRVFSMLGIGAGSICLAAVALLAYASLHALAKASARTGVMNMSVLAREELGVTGQAVLDMALIFNCFGMLVVYLVVIGDMLVGSPGEPGILTQDCGSRRVVLAVVAVVLLAPLVSSTSTQSRSLAGASALGVAAILLWAAVSLILFIIAANNGALSHMHWWPKGHALIGHGFKSAVELTSLLSIMLVAYTCHWTLQHSMQSASSVRERQAQGVSAGAIAASTATFLLISICSYGVFGNATSADVINNYSVETLSKLLIPELAQAGFFGIRLGVLIALLLSFPLHMAPLRTSLWQLVFRQPLQGPGLYLVTYVTLGAAWLAAAHLSDIWSVLILIGSTAGVLISLILPGLLSIGMEETLTETRGSKIRRQGGGLVLILFGIGIGAAGILHLAMYAGKTPHF